MPWAVVEFVESEVVEAVPQNWLNRPSGVGQDRVFYWWPPRKSQKYKHLISVVWKEQTTMKYGSSAMDMVSCMFISRTKRCSLA